MPERHRRPDFDEKFSLFPEEGEDVLRGLLGSPDDPGDDDPPLEGEEP